MSGPGNFSDPNRVVQSALDCIGTDTDVAANNWFEVVGFRRFPNRGRRRRRDFVAIPAYLLVPGKEQA
ncbi:MAG: hypothetical protein ACR2RL_20140, partial [Gammaproteobacteria bacterium]